MRGRFGRAEELIEACLAEQDRGVTLIEHFVLEQCDGGASPAEILSRWERTGTAQDRPHTVRLLREAVVILARHGFVEVHEHSPDTSVAVPVQDIWKRLADENQWSTPASTGTPVMVTLTDAGSAYL